MIHPNPDKRLTFAQIYATDWFVNTPKATLEEAKKLFAERGLKIYQPTPVKIVIPKQEGEMSSSEDEEVKKHVPLQSRVPGRMRSVKGSGNDSELEEEIYRKIYREVRLASKEQPVEEFEKIKLFNMNLEAICTDPCSILANFII